jgi:16S rRNA (cytosine967-C5)-methyltransferase
LGIDQTEELCRANNEIPPFTLRTNLLKTNRKELLSLLEREGLSAGPTAYSPEGVTLGSPAGKIGAMNIHQQGLVHIQDEASQLISHLVAPQPGESILDLCAGSGGKSTHLAQLMENRGRILAVDSNTQQIKALQDMAGRLGVTIIEGRMADATKDLGEPYQGRFDRILVDAPCSGSGTMRRNPEIKWRLREKDLLNASALQKKILDQASLYLKQGGTLVYATCSVMPEENDIVIEDFLLHHPDFQPAPPPAALAADLFDPRKGYFRTYPQRHKMDGFFAVVLRKS